MVDMFSSETRRTIMQSVKSTKTKLENSVAEALRGEDLRFRRNVSDLLGKPDMAIKKSRTVIFIDSCFWHGCGLHGRIPQTNTEFWFRKISKNRARDAEITRYYVEKGWHILRVWEHELKQDFNVQISKIADFMRRGR